MLNREGKYNKYAHEHISIIIKLPCISAVLHRFILINIHKPLDYIGKNSMLCLWECIFHLVILTDV